VALFLWVPFFCTAQNIIKGTVIDSVKQPLSYSIVTAYKDPSYTSIVGFKTTDDLGKFSIEILEKIDTLFLEARHITYKSEQFIITGFNKEHQLTLFRPNNDLKEVLIEAKRNITIKGDTVRYDVDALKEKKDYTIEEVIDRIPGVTIAENGQISYNDRPISHLYINGVDLLEGRYNIATRGIPAGAVEDIELLRRHNHARIEIGKTLSSEVALNLRIKKNQSLVFGSSKADIGTPLLTARGEVTPIYLRDKLQNIASLRANNFGKSLQDFGTNLTRGNRDIYQLKMNNTSVITPPEVNGNTISNRYWLDNNSVSATNDILTTLPKELIVKGSVDYNYEDSEIEKNNQSVFFTGNDSLKVDRSSINKLSQTRYQLGNTIELNRDDLYINNKLSGRFIDQNGNSSNILNNNAIQTGFKNTEKAITNILELKNSINNQIVDSGILFEYRSTDEQLTTNPAVFTDLIPGANATITTQDVAMEKMNIGAYTGYTFQLLDVEWKAKQHVRWSKEQLESSLKNQNINNSTLPFATDFSLDSFESQTQLSSAFNWRRFRFNLNPEVSYFNINRMEELTDSNEKDNYLFMNMNVQVSRNFNRKWDLGVSGSIKSSISSFEELYPGIILRQFDNLSTNPQDINVTRSNNASLFFGYSDVLSGILLKNNTSYNNSTSQFIFNRSLDDNGLIQINAIRQDNQFSTIRNTTTLTKRFFKHLSTQTSYNFDLSKIEQIFNGQSQDNTIINHTLSTELSWSTNGSYALSYSGTINFGLSLIDSSRAANNFQLHNLGLDLYLSDKARWNFNTETAISSFSSSDNTNVNSLFNTSFYYKPHKKLILRAELYNIFNERFFTTATSSSNFISQNQFSLRPIQFTVGLNYTL
jgi:hypothetical protein